MEKELAKIPFGKPARIGNFKIWRSKMELTFTPDITEKEMDGKGRTVVRKQKETIECINISNLDGTWMTRIAETFEMFVMLTECYDWYMSDDEEAKQRGEDYLTTVLSNLLWVSNITNGYYHEGVFMVGMAYAHPELLTDKKKFKDFKKEAEGVMDRYVNWRKDFDKFSNKDLSKEELKQDEMVQEIMDTLEKDETAES